MTTHTGPAQPQEGPPFRLQSVAVSAYGPTVLEAMGYGAAIPLVPLLARQLGASVGLAAFVAGMTRPRAARHLAARRERDRPRR